MVEGVVPHRGVPFERYAADIVIHCTRMSEAVRIRESLTRRMSEVGLTINEEKSKIVYIDTFERHNVATSFTFLGYDFKVRTLRNSKGELFRKCMPGGQSPRRCPPAQRILQRSGALIARSNLLAWTRIADGRPNIANGFLMGLPLLIDHLPQALVDGSLGVTDCRAHHRGLVVTT
jgi:hypothetical protein